ELNADAAVGSPNVTVNMGASATVAFASDQDLAGLAINGGTVATAASGDVQISAGSVSITGGGKLDLGMGSLLLDSASVSAGAIRQYLFSGYNAGQWNGAGGISSSWAGAGPGRAVGFAEGADGMVSGLAAG